MDSEVNEVNAQDDIAVQKSPTWRCKWQRHLAIVIAAEPYTAEDAALSLG